MNTLGLMLAGIALNATAQLLLRIGMQRIGHFELTAANVTPVAWQVITSLPVIGGIACFVMSVLVWLVVLSRMDVSQAYPMMSIGYILTALAAYFWLGEQLGPMRVAGIAVIMLGVWMISRPA